MMCRKEYSDHFFTPVWSGLVRFGQGDMTDGEWWMRLPNYPRIQSVHGDYSLPPEEYFSPDIADIADKSMFAGVFAFSSPDNALTMQRFIPVGKSIKPMFARLSGMSGH